MQLKLIFALSLFSNVRVFGMVYSITVGGLNFVQEHCFVKMNFVPLAKYFVSGLFVVNFCKSNVTTDYENWLDQYYWEEDEMRSWKSLVERANFPLKA